MNFRFNFFSVSLNHGEGYYELCLAVIETGTVYYLHQDLCTELGGKVATRHGHQLTLTPGTDMVTLGWTPSNLTSTVKLTVRQR